MTPLKFLIFLVTGFLLLVVTGLVVLYFSIANDLPSMQQLENPKQNQATQIFSDDGELLDHFFIQKRVNLPYDSIPQPFFNALIATEDRKFFDHWGVHVERIVKATVKNILSMRTKEGASTITMQLSRNLFYNQDITLSRKLKEAVTSMQIEKTFTKKEILAKYANTVAFGRGAYGINVASMVYFNKSPMELTLSECAFLVAILKAPEHYNGVVDYDKGLERRNLVLSMMRDQELITSAEYVTASQEPIELNKQRLSKKGFSIAPHFVEMIRQQLAKDQRLKQYDLYRDGLVIYTTLNSKIQKYAEEAVLNHLTQYQQIFNKSWSWNNNSDILKVMVTKAIKQNPEFKKAKSADRDFIENKLGRDKKFIDSVKNYVTTVQAGLVVMDQTNGAILAMVGGSPKFMEENPDAKYSLNHTTQIRRQPGSTFKPYVYAAALMEGLTPSSTIESGPYTYVNPETNESWSPRGTGGEGGLVTLAGGLAASINTVSARLITQVTTPMKVINLAQRMGIESPLKAVPALALGAGGELTPLEMTNGYATIANEGVYYKHFAIKRIEDKFGNIIFEQKLSGRSLDACPPLVAHQMASMMQGVVERGTGTEIRKHFKGVDAAGKTGTTNDYADAWFIGFTPQLTAGVWVGFDDRRITFTGGYGYAAKAAAPIWGKLFAKIYADQELPFRQTQFSFHQKDSLDSLNNNLPMEEAAPKDEHAYNDCIIKSIDTFVILTKEELPETKNDKYIINNIEKVYYDNRKRINIG
jgi:penicillin-binding protein 1A